MIPHKVKSVIESCKTPDHFEICRKWVDAIYNEGSEAHTYAMSCIKQAETRVGFVASKRAIHIANDERFPVDDEYIETVHTMD